MDKKNIEQCTCTEVVEKSENSFALEVLREQAKQSKRLVIALIITLILWFTTIGVGVYYLSLYDISTTEVTVDSGETGGDANYIGNDGDIVNG